MQTLITSDISRLSLHDSSFENIVRRGKHLKLTFDWAKLDNFKEANIDEAIIMGKTKIFLTGVHSEQFKIFDPTDSTMFIIPSLPENYATETEVIGTTSINDDAKSVKIGRLIKENEAYRWTEWSFLFDTCEVSWTSFVTYSEWQNGKLPED